MTAAKQPLCRSSLDQINLFTAENVWLSIGVPEQGQEIEWRQDVQGPRMRSRLGHGEGKNGETEVLMRMKGENSVSKQECPSCGGTNLEEDAFLVRCLDCGMGKYKGGRPKC